MDNPYQQLSKLDFLDAIITDYTSQDIVKYLKSVFNDENKAESLSGIIYRFEDNIIDENKEFEKIINIPIPRHDLFPNDKYKYPFTLRTPFIQMLTDYGCPYKCSFCIFGALKYKRRDLNNILDEMYILKQNGVKEIMFGDQTFGVIRDHAVELCKKMIENKFNFTWSCYSRVDIMDEEMLRLFKKAGCHTIIFGVESGSDEILKKYEKGFTVEQVKKTFALAKKIGIRRAATFIIGLPGEKEEDCLRTIKLAIDIDADYASFNTPVPRKNTKLREEALEKHYVDEDLEDMDQSGTYSVMDTEYLDHEKIWELKEKAVKSFYIRPGYVMKRLFGIRSLHELKNLITEGLSLLGKIN